MSDLKAPARRADAVPCNECGAPVWVPYTALCDTCFDAVYRNFRALTDWPL